MAQETRSHGKGAKSKERDDVDASQFRELLKSFEPGETIPERTKAVRDRDAVFGVSLGNAARRERGTGKELVVQRRERILTALRYFGGGSEEARSNIAEAVNLVAPEGSRGLYSGAEADRAATYENLVPHPVSTKMGYFRDLLIEMYRAGVRPEIVDRLEEDIRQVASKQGMDVFPERVFPCAVNPSLRFCDSGPAHTIKHMVVIDKRTLPTIEDVETELTKIRSLRTWSEREAEADERYMQEHSPEDIARVFDTPTFIDVARHSFRFPILDRAAYLVGLRPDGTLRTGGMNAEYAIASAARDLGRGLEDSSARRLIGDYRSVANGLIMQLKGLDPAEEVRKTIEIIRGLDEHSIIVADDMTPRLANLIAEHAKIDTVVFDRPEMATTHSAIILQNSGVRVTSSKGCAEQISTGDPVLVDCFSPNEPTIISCPTRRNTERFEPRRQEYERTSALLREKAMKPVKTKDGVSVTIRGNVDRIGALDMACENGISGVGLLRSEVEVMDAPEFPIFHLESVLYSGYTAFAREFRKREISRKRQPISVRLFDFGRAKPNPFRGIPQEHAGGDNQGAQFLINNPEVLAAQVRAMMRANAEDGNLRMDIPYWRDPRQIWEIVETIKLQDSRMDNDGTKHRQCPVGVMVETADSVRNLREVLESGEISFVSIGTNDLSADMISSDSPNPVNDVLHAKVLMAMKDVVDLYEEQDVPVSVCGQMAADPVGAALLVGMGVRELSVTPQVRPFVAYMLSQVRVEDLEEIADEVLGFRDSPKMPERVRKFVGDKLTELGVSPEILVAGFQEKPASGKVAERHMPAEAESLLRRLDGFLEPDFMRGVTLEIAQKDSKVAKGPDDMYYYRRLVDNLAGGGIHGRVTLAFNRSVSKAGLEMFSPRKAERGLMGGFVPCDIGVMTGSADNGDYLYFRSYIRSTLEQVEKFFRTTRLAVEVSRGD